METSTNASRARNHASGARSAHASFPSGVLLLAAALGLVLNDYRTAWAQALAPAEQQTELQQTDQATSGQATSGASETLESNDKAAEKESLAPIDTVVIHDIEKRPAWVESEPTTTDNIDRVSVSAGPHARLEDCQRDLKDEIQKATDLYIAHYMKNSAAPRMVHYRSRYIPIEVAPFQNYYEETITVSIGPMKQVHALLEFDDSFRREIDRRWEEGVALSRLRQTAFGGGSLFLLLALAWGYFRVDTATRGYYTRRLQFGATATILALFAFAAWLAQQFVWV